jgi:hypothetical protein
VSNPFLAQLEKMHDRFQQKPLGRLNPVLMNPRTTNGATLGAAGGAVVRSDTASTAFFERVINEFLVYPLVLTASTNPTRRRIDSTIHSHAVAYWVAIHVNAWLRAWPGRQHALVTGVERFDAAGDVYARLTVTVGHNGRYTPFLVLVRRTGTTSLSLDIGPAFGPFLVRPVYTAVGYSHPDLEGKYGYVTLPTGNEKGAKGGL